jgi:hypothetical protein
MKKSDVRIGNWLKCYKGEYFQVTLEDLINWDNLPEDQKHSPIELDEAWLLDFDWPCDRKANEETDTDGLWIKDGITLFQESYKPSEFNYATYVRGNGEFKGGFSMKYVHQLQNLYHGMSPVGRELVRKPFYTR